MSNSPETEQTSELTSGEMREIIGHGSTQFVFMKFRKIKLLRTNYQNNQQTILIEIEDDSKADVVKELQFLVSYATKECVSICKHLCQTKV